MVSLKAWQKIAINQLSIGNLLCPYLTKYPVQSQVKLSIMHSTDLLVKMEGKYIYIIVVKL